MTALLQYVCVSTQNHRRVNSGLGSEGHQGDADPITEMHTRSFVHRLSD